MGNDEMTREEERRLSLAVNLKQSDWDIIVKWRICLGVPCGVVSSDVSTVSFVPALN